MSRQDEIAAKAIRKSTLRSISVKKKSRLRQLKADYEAQVRELNLQYSEDPDRLRAKYAADDFAKTEKKKKRAAKRIENAKKLIEIQKSTRILTTGEEIACSIVQGLGCALFIAATAILETLAVRRLDDFVNTTVVFYALFGSSMILMYLFSLLQHALTNITGKTVFNRLSHIWAFLVIGFTYSAYSITKVQGILGWILFGIVWVLNFIGIMFYAISGQKHEKLNTVLYIIAGFSGIVVTRVLFKVLPITSFATLATSSVCYLLGVIFYNLRKIKYMHFLANIALLAGNVLMFFSLFFIN